MFLWVGASFKQLQELFQNFQCFVSLNFCWWKNLRQLW